MPPIITLITDFGNEDTYVGQMKGAMLSVCPQAQLVDLTHQIPPGDIRGAAVAWADAIPAFPESTIHLAVIDPGVGSSRRAVAVEIGPWKVVCPDNGLVTPLLKLEPQRRGVELNDSRWWRKPASHVFHGRDIFGPVAAAWAAGHDLSELGSLITDPMVTINDNDAIVAPDRIQGKVTSIDHFGNVITNIPGELLAGPFSAWTVHVRPHEIRGLSTHYGEQPRGSVLALIGSHGRLELAVNQGRAAEALDVSVGTAVILRRD